MLYWFGVYAFVLAGVIAPIVLVYAILKMWTAASSNAHRELLRIISHQR